MLSAILSAPVPIASVTNLTFATRPEIDVVAVAIIAPDVFALIAINSATVAESSIVTVTLLTSPFKTPRAILSPLEPIASVVILISAAIPEI
jgi:hypothetical protein